MTLTSWLIFAGGAMTAFAAGRWSVPAWAMAAMDTFNPGTRTGSLAP